MAPPQRRRPPQRSLKALDDDGSGSELGRPLHAGPGGTPHIRRLVHRRPRSSGDAAPVDVFQPQARDFTPTQTQPQQRDQQRVVAPTNRSATIAAGEQRGGLVSSDRPRQRRTPPTSDRQRRLRQIDLDEALDETETQEGAQASHEVLGRAHRHHRRPPQHRTREATRPAPVEVMEPVNAEDARPDRRCAPQRSLG
jgi:hypothetical protein